MNVQIKYYALCYIISFIIIRYLSINRFINHIQGSNKYNNDMQYRQLQYTLDIILQYSFMIGIIGGRIGYILLDYPENLPIMHKLYDGFMQFPWYGMDFKSGALAFIVLLILMLYCYGITKRYIYEILESIAIYAPIGLGIGRFGNFLNNEFMDTVNIYIAFWNLQMPVCLLAMLLEGFTAFALMYMINYMNASNKIALFFIIYSIMRFITDIYRPEPKIISVFNLSQIICMIILIISIIYLIHSRLYHPKNHDMI